MTALLAWIVAGIVAFATGRLLPVGWRKQLPLELAVSLLFSLAAGVAATVLDFGGWSELDWRAFVFATLVALAAVGGLRLIRPASQEPGPMS